MLNIYSFFYNIQFELGFMGGIMLFSRLYEELNNHSIFFNMIYPASSVFFTIELYIHPQPCTILLITVTICYEVII